MNTQHTPGPWEVHPIRTRENGIPVIYVTHVGGFDTCELHGSYPQLEANARLIAAAPDLLEVLDDILFECDWKDNLELVARVHSVVDRIRGAK